MSNAYLEQAKLMRASITGLSANADDETLINNKSAFPFWNGNGVSYSADDKVQYDDKLYRVLQAHTSQSDWLPTTAVSLFVEISLEEYPEWVQPTGAHDAYALGAKVSHNSKHWVSDIDANVYEPSVYGWSEVE